MLGIFGSKDTTPQFVLSANAAWFRPLAVFLDRPTDHALLSQVRAMQQLPSSGKPAIKIILTVRANGDYQVASSPIDTVKYEGLLDNVLKLYRPDIVAVENEMNWDHYWTGTPEEYVNELKSACKVAHAYGIKVTDGGLVNNAANSVVLKTMVDDASDSGEKDDQAKALKFYGEAFEDANRTTFAKLKKFVDSQPVAVPLALINGIASTDADYVNFHHYNGTGFTLQTKIDYLFDLTGKFVVCNEAGIWKDSSKLVTELVSTWQAVTGDSDGPLVWNNTKSGKNDDNIPLHDAMLGAFKNANS